MKHLPRTILPLILGLLTQVSLVSAAQAQDTLRRGRALLQEFCAPCHTIGRTGVSHGAPPFSTLGRNFDLDQFPRLLERGISSTHPNMPEFKFSEDDAHAATAYLRSIQR
jgi:mono/diheme cytochrome c family protein